MLGADDQNEKQDQADAYRAAGYTPKLASQEEPEHVKRARKFLALTVEIERLEKIYEWNRPELIARAISNLGIDDSDPELNAAIELLKGGES